MSDRSDMRMGQEPERETAPYENQQFNLDQVDEKDFRPDPARHHIGEDYPKVEPTHQREDPYH